MAKVTVILHCQVDNGKESKQPGDSLSMDEAQARSLAAMGMVTLPPELAEEAVQALPAKKSKAAKANKTPSDDESTERGADFELP